MATISDMSDALLTLYDAAYFDQDWVRALDAICDVSQARGVMVYAADQTDLLYNVGLANSLYADKAAEVSEYNERFVSNRETSHERVGMEFISGQPAFAPVLDTDIWPLKYLNTEPSVLFAKHHVGVFRRLCFNLSDTPDLQSGLILQYGTEIADPPQSDIDTMPLLMPHVGKAIATSRFFSPLRQRYNAVLSVLDRLNLAVAVLDQHGRVVIANQATRDLLERRDGVQLSPDGRIRCQSDAEDRAFAAAWSEIAQTAQGQGQITDTSLFVSRQGHVDPLLAILSPLRDASGEVDRTLSGSMVAFVDTTRIIQTDMDTFGSAYGLTPAECAVATLMRDGSSASEIAEQRSVSPETIATQIKSILAKTGTHNRVQFVWKLVQFSPPVL